MIPIVASLLGSLAENGLGLLSSALQAKGKEVVEKTLGVKIPDNPTPEDVANCASFSMNTKNASLSLALRKPRWNWLRWSCWQKPLRVTQIT
jgi:hypothetical protein